MFSEPGVFQFAIIDVYSRRIVGWSISNTMSMEWCRETLSDAIRTEGKPEIFNTDQGSQFTSPGFIHPLLEKGIKVTAGCPVKRKYFKSSGISRQLMVKSFSVFLTWK